MNKIDENKLLDKFNNNISIKDLPNDIYYEIFSKSLIELEFIKENDLTNITIIPNKINEIFYSKKFKVIHNFMVHVLQKVDNYQNKL
jgi:hypothetical protein